MIENRSSKWDWQRANGDAIVLVLSPAAIVPVSNPSLPSRIARLAAALPLVLLAAGCALPLAFQDPYFATTRTTVARTDAETQRALRHSQALQAAQRECPTPAASPAEECIAFKRAPTAWHGATAGAYRRWAEDRIPKLPAPDDTAGGVGGGS